MKMAGLFPLSKPTCEFIPLTSLRMRWWEHSTNPVTLGHHWKPYCELIPITPLPHSLCPPSHKLCHTGTSSRTLLQAHWHLHHSTQDGVVRIPLLSLPCLHLPPSPVTWAAPQCKAAWSPLLPLHPLPTMAPLEATTPAGGSVISSTTLTVHALSWLCIHYIYIPSCCSCTTLLLQSRCHWIDRYRFILLSQTCIGP